MDPFFCFQDHFLALLSSQIGRQASGKRLEIYSNIRIRRDCPLKWSFVSGKHFKKVVILRFWQKRLFHANRNSQPEQVQIWSSLLHPWNPFHRNPLGETNCRAAYKEKTLFRSAAEVSFSWKKRIKKTVPQACKFALSSESRKKLFDTSRGNLFAIAQDATRILTSNTRLVFSWQT